MKITNFLCCEYATLDSGGKVTLVGAGIDWVSVPAFPARFAFYLFARCTVDVNDVPGTKTARLKVVGEDQLVGTQEMPFEIHEGRPNANLITIVDIQSEKPAKFRFELTIEGSEQIATWPLEIRQAEPPASPALAEAGPGP